MIFCEVGDQLPQQDPGFLWRRRYDRRDAQSFQEIDRGLARITIEDAQKLFPAALQSLRNRRNVGDACPVTLI